MPPRTYDVAIQTVIGPELRAILQALGIPENSKFHDRGSIFWHGRLESLASERELDVVVHCQGEPGNHGASAAATKLLERFRPSFMVLSGIAAGRRGKVKIGDVAIPRVVADLTQRVAESGGTSARPAIDRLLYPVTQLLRPFSPERAGFGKRFHDLFGEALVPPPGAEAEYAEHVAVAPNIHEAAIASQDLLLRDPRVIEGLATSLHQQIRIGEMEAAGFISACESRSPVVPWLVVRGVSDFGDEFKGDEFHRMASVAAAAYVSVFLEYGFDVRVVGGKSKRKPPPRNKTAKTPEPATQDGPTQEVAPATQDGPTQEVAPATQDGPTQEVAPATQDGPTQEVVPASPEGTPAFLFEKGQLVRSTRNRDSFALRNGTVTNPKVAPNLIEVQWPGREPQHVYADTVELEDEQPEPVESRTNFQMPLVVLHSRTITGSITLHDGPTFLMADVTWWNALPPELARLKVMQGSGQLRAIISGSQPKNEEQVATAFAGTIRQWGGILIRVNELWNPENGHLRDMLVASIRRAQLVNPKVHPRFGAIYDFAATAGAVARDVITAFHDRLAGLATPGMI